MKTQLILVVLVVLIVATGALHVFAGAQPHSTGQAGQTAESMGAAGSQPGAWNNSPTSESTIGGPKKAGEASMAGGEMTDQEMMDRMHARMKEAGIPEGTMMKHDMMMNAQFQGDEPNSLLTMRKDLKLTEDQVKKIEEIGAKARKEAGDVLTPEQKATVAKLSGPNNMMGMQREMMSKGVMGPRGRQSGMMKEGGSTETPKETTAK